MHDPFEESLRHLLNTSSTEHDDQACLGKVLKAANRQVGVGDLVGLMGHWLSALLLALNTGSGNVKPRRRTPNPKARNRT